ncbi:glypican-5-like isoform X2 [Cololabis saira]|uniref:glypican-5-like isoform X2 n=1 Tax=Cololabis saira TaxID=129043 RepID=UPI002AD53CD6|nr:glypican-5-like isoform X2 [Cololabis saira]
MSRGVSPRVNSRSSVRMVTLVVLAVSVIAADAYSCHEVKTVFQLRQVGPLHRVPETPVTDVDLLVCKHGGPSCCTRKMEESYQTAVKRETLHNIHSYSYELEHLISGHADAFQDMFQYLLSFSQGHLSSLLEGTYSSLSRHALPHVNQLFSSLSLYLRGANVSVEATVHQFFNNIFPLVYTRLINPGTDGSATADSNIGDCLRMTRQDVNPFGHHPAVMAQELAGALGVGRQLGLALEEGLEVMNATEHPGLSKECVKSLVKMVFCSHCRGLTLIKPCGGYCLNVMRGCLASVSELDQPWRRYTNLLEQLTLAVAGHHSLELSLLGVRVHVEEALFYAQVHGSLITAMVDKVCGLSTEEPTGMQPPANPEVTTSAMTSSPPLPSAAPSQASPEKWLKQIAHLKREFFLHLQRYKSFFAALPEMLCEGENVAEDSTCWSGDDLVESYTGRVVGNGLHAQRQNPEVKVRGVDPTMAEVKGRLERFIQETQERFPQLGQMDGWEEFGSGEEEGSTECDDEDGCQSSGDGQEKTLHKDVTTESKSNGRQPGGDTKQEAPQKPPSVRVIGGSPPSCWLQPCSLVLLFAGLCLQWMLF